METVGNKSDDTVVCYAPTMITTNGVWQGDNPLDYSLPLFILQMTLVVVSTRFFDYILKPLRQPRVVSEILGGALLGPTALGRSENFANTMFPLRSVMVLETMANIGLLYYLFLVGVEMDLSVIRQTGKKALAIAVAGMIMPFIIGIGFSFVLHSSDPEPLAHVTYVLFLGVALSVTAFPVLARILAELKLINSELGRLALSSALINDMCAWILLAVAIALAENDPSSLASLWVLLSSAAFVVICILFVRPAISWMIRRTPEGESFSDLYICFILTGVMISAFITDAIGTHSVFGAFVFGLIIPNGPLGVTLIEKLEDFVSGLLLPLFFAISGLKTDVTSIREGQTWGIMFVVIILSCAGKIGGTMLVTTFYNIPHSEGFILGLLMNTKGLIEMIVLNVGKDQQVLDDEAFAIMVIVALIMTAIISPIVAVIYRQTRRFAPYKRRTIQISKPEGELRVLTCVHTPRHVPTIINLLEASHPAKKSPLCVYVLHLVELTGRASAMLIVHNTRQSGRPALNRTQAQSDHIIHAFENFEQNLSFISVQPLTAISPYSSMHEDICGLAEDKRVALIIIPFHKQQTVDGGMEVTNPAFRTVNQNLLANAPCSVGILVDRGLSTIARVTENEVAHHVVVLFFGGPDDREALAYGLRMCENPGVRVTVLRFIAGEESLSATMQPPPLTTDQIDPPMLTIETDTADEKQLDDDYVNDFRMKNANNEMVVYTEQVVNNGEQTVSVIRSLDIHHDLFIVGRGQGMTSPITAGLTDWSECPELGVIGDILASSDFATTISVLVIQQYVGVVPQESVPSPDSPDGQPDDETSNRQTPTAPSTPPSGPHAS
ncbi:Cation/H(+) antiporter 15 [Hibiscus syriacus]|uniref:Cation/H(+) antiporter 15 n=1 Tax=Hibiscus syriacus TaxID=106335 RepID=A0A6A2WRH0_HIBSY|nr:cation/H(+) antiporter 15-like [Hibiscus syriacus]KAE8663622.1 Cation/H(+) antiporter 15 [Hibiscus syriacus]